MERPEKSIIEYNIISPNIHRSATHRCLRFVVASGASVEHVICTFSVGYQIPHTTTTRAWGDHDELRMGKPATKEPSSNFCCCFLNPGVVSLLVCHQFLSPSLANPWHSLHQTRTRPDTVYICICYDIDFSLNSVTHT